MTLSYFYFCPCPYKSFVPNDVIIVFLNLSSSFICFWFLQCNTYTSYFTCSFYVTYSGTVLKELLVTLHISLSTILILFLFNRSCVLFKTHKSLDFGSLVLFQVYKLFEESRDYPVSFLLVLLVSALPSFGISCTYFIRYFNSLMKKKNVSCVSIISYTKSHRFL